jgi:hypothetical protein
MNSEYLSAILGLLGGLAGGLISAWATLQVQKKSNADLEKDEIRRKKVQIIYNLLGSRYVISDTYNAGPTEVQVFNTAMALFSVYFQDDDVRKKFDKFITNKTDENLIEMLKAAAKTADLDLLDSTISKIVTVKPSVLPLEIVTQYLGSAKTEKK